MNIKTDDWKNEKHVPVIKTKKEGEYLIITVEVGKEIKHPNTFDHHIKWIEVFFVDNEDAFPLGRIEFEAHGEKGFTKPFAVFRFKPKGNGKIVALSFCNIHGLWKNSLEV